MNGTPNIYITGSMKRTHLSRKFIVIFCKCMEKQKSKNVGAGVTLRAHKLKEMSPKVPRKNSQVVEKCGLNFEKSKWKCFPGRWGPLPQIRSHTKPHNLIFNQFYRRTHSRAGRVPEFSFLFFPIKLMWGWNKHARKLKSEMGWFNSVQMKKNPWCRFESRFFSTQSWIDTHLKAILPKKNSKFTHRKTNFK